MNISVGVFCSIPIGIFAQFCSSQAACTRHDITPSFSKYGTVPTIALASRMATLANCLRHVVGLKPTNGQIKATYGKRCDVVCAYPIAMPMWTEPSTSYCRTSCLPIVPSSVLRCAARKMQRISPSPGHNVVKSHGRTDPDKWMGLNTSAIRKFCSQTRTS